MHQCNRAHETELTNVLAMSVYEINYQLITQETDEAWMLLDDSITDSWTS